MTALPGLPGTSTSGPDRQAELTRVPLTARLFSRLWLTAGLGLLSACESAVSVDLATDPPDEVLEVRIAIEGIEFETDGGGVETLRFDEPDPVDLLDFSTGSRYSVIVNEELSPDRYTGLRLLFDDEDAELVLADGGSLSLALAADQPFVPVSFSIEEDGDEDLSLSLRLDLRLSIGDPDEDDNDDERLLGVVGRALRSQDAASVSGRVADERIESQRCRDGLEVGVGVAAYLFQGAAVEPDDFDSQSPDPLATTPVVFDGSAYAYSFTDLEAGDYTLAIACRADTENPLDDESDDDERPEFIASADLTLDSAESAELNFD